MKLRGLYAIVDTGALTKAALDPIAFAREVLAARPAALQLRAKSDSSDRIAELARVIGARCREAKVPFVLNDRADLAKASECDLVHLGQHDAPESATEVPAGISTHTPEQLRKALALRQAYVAYGPVFATTSKENADAVVGLEGLAEARKIIAASEAPHTPLVAIGGISLQNASRVAELADAGAVIGALICDDVWERARALHAALGGEP